MKRQLNSDTSKRARARIGPGLDIPAETRERYVALRPKAATLHIANPVLDQGRRRNTGPLLPGAKSKAMVMPALRPPPPKHPPATRPKAATVHIAHAILDQGPRREDGAGKKKKKETIATKKALMPYFDIMDDPYFIKV